MNELAGALLVRVLPDWVEGKISATPQDHSKATYTRKFTKTDGLIDLTDDAYNNFLKIQAFKGSIGTYFFAEKSGEKVRLTIREATWRDGKLAIFPQRNTSR